jgi:hypothetical protein
MAGSRKGERRGNARKRPAPGSPHEKPRDIMREAISHNPTKRGDRGLGVAAIEKRITVARIIHGDTGNVLDMTPKEVMLAGMHHNMQAVSDWKKFLDHLAKQPVTQETIRLSAHAETEIERLLDKAVEHAFKVAPMIHPRLSAIALAPTQGDNQGSILQELLGEIDELQRAEPVMIEYQPKKRMA